MQLNLNHPVKIALADRKGFFLCDAEDCARVLLHRWHLRLQKGKPVVYARFCGQIIHLHRFILPVDGRISFKDGDRLNATKRNLLVKAGGDR